MNSDPLNAAQLIMVVHFIDSMISNHFFLSLSSQIFFLIVFVKKNARLRNRNIESNMAVSSILVLGAAELGTAVIEALAAHPGRHETRLAISIRPNSFRSPSESKKTQLDGLRALNVTAIPLDIEAASQTELAAEFTRYNMVIGCTGMAGSSGLQMKLAQAALEAGVARYIPWQFGVDYDIIGPRAANGLFAAQCEIRSLLRSQSGTRWVIISTGIFMSFLFENIFGIIERTDEKVTVRAFGDWDNELTATAVEDIGRCTAEIVFRAEELWRGHEGSGGVVHIASDTVSFEQLAETVEKFAKSPVEKELWPTHSLRDQMDKNPDDGICKYRVIWAENKGVGWSVEKSFNGQRGMKMERIREWAERHFSGEI